MRTDNSRPSDTRAELFLENAVAQVAPQIIRRIYEAEGARGAYVLSPEDKQRRLLDYLDAIQHDAPTLRGVLSPISPP